MENNRNKIKCVGSKSVADTKTGEIERASVLHTIKQDLNFAKIFLPKKGYRMYTKEMTLATRILLEYLCIIMDKQNFAIAPVHEIAERIDLSIPSISRAKAQLFELDYMRQRSTNLFMLNPTFICKCDGDKRIGLFESYSGLPLHITKKQTGTVIN